jgi:hypothetical protein
VRRWAAVPPWPCPTIGTARIAALADSKRIGRTAFFGAVALYLPVSRIT